MPLIEVKPVIAPYRGRASHQFTGGHDWCLKTWKKTSGSTGGREKALAIEKPPWYNSKRSGNRITKNTKEVFNNGKEKHK